MRKRAVLVGINDYPRKPLSGCLNDVEAMREWLVQRGFDASTEIIRVRNTTADKATILADLRWLVRGAQPGDERVFFFSGHGTRLATRDPGAEEDGLDEALCAHGYDETLDTAVRDKDCAAILDELPPSANLLWICDSCYSGGMTRAIEFAGGPMTSRNLPLSDEAASRARAAIERRAAVGRMRNVAKPRPVVFIGACQENTVSYEAKIGDTIRGALTHFLLEALRKPEGAQVPVATLVRNVTAAMRAARFEQEPVFEVPDGFGDRGIFG